MLGKLIASQFQNVLKSILKIEGTVGELQKKFDGGCPTKDELQRILIQKNTLQTSLTVARQVLNGIEITGKTLEGTITGLQAAVQVIKFLPAPLPPFTPLTVVNLLADSLDTLGGILKNAKGSVKMVPQVFGGITPLIDQVISKLNTLDTVLNNCIESQGLTQKDITNTLLNSGQLSNSQGKWVLVEEVLTPYLKPEGIPPNPPTPFVDDNGNVWEYEISTIEDLDLPTSNTISNDDLLKQLQPGSTTPFIYKDFKLEIQSDPKNEFSFASRRIKSQKQEGESITLYNTENGSYSFSSSLEVLIDEAKLQIDNYYLPFIIAEEEARRELEEKERLKREEEERIARLKREEEERRRLELATIKAQKIADIQKSIQSHKREANRLRGVLSGVRKRKKKRRKRIQGLINIQNRRIAFLTRRLTELQSK